ncbi:AfsR/SARP family transcriptional regulator [Kribbella deserti]|uniref:BTAD domain-containing putative transcriptional regulator n=1 Tax=Kribbella deserti TaxID=1926257 RepID=A0ABV6QK86_9ACTN
MGVQVGFGVLGPVTAWDEAGAPIALKGPRHRAVLARLIVARGRVVPIGLLVDDLWLDPPAGAVSAVRTFVAALRRAIEPDRPARTPPRLLVTEGPGYALRVEPDAVDAWRFERAVANSAATAADLEEALALWRGPAYAEFTDETWAHAERSRLAELRLHAVERLAEARLSTVSAAAAIPDLDAHVTEHPWREDGWRLLALALYQAGRQGDALAVLRRARTLLVEQLGVDPGPALRRVEADILNHAPGLDPTPAADRVWADATAAYDRTVASSARARLESTVGLLRNLAVTGGGGLQAARQHRLAAITAAEELGDPELTARIIGAYDVPAIWTRSDDEEHARQVVATAERTLRLLPQEGHEAARARLLATIALESRGTTLQREPSLQRGPEAARQAEEIARRLDDPALLCFALNGVFMQSFQRAGLAARRDEIGAELISLATKYGLVGSAVLGHLVRLQALSALGNFTEADKQAEAADDLAERHELPLVGVFTQWYRALRLAATGNAPVDEVETAYRAAAQRLDGAGMPGLERGLLPLALLCLRLQYDLPIPTDEDWGPYEPWVRPLVLLAEGRREEASAALRAVPEPPRDLLLEASWCLIARAAADLSDQAVLARARAVLDPAAGELAGAASGLLTLGPVARYLDG